MKKKSLVYLMCLFALISFTSCDNDEDDPEDQPTAVSGEWKYSDVNVDIKSKNGAIIIDANGTAIPDTQVESIFEAFIEPYVSLLQTVNFKDNGSGDVTYMTPSDNKKVEAENFFLYTVSGNNLSIQPNLASIIAIIQASKSQETLSLTVPFKFEAEDNELYIYLTKTEITNIKNQLDYILNTSVLEVLFGDQLAEIKQYMQLVDMILNQIDSLEIGIELKK